MNILSTWANSCLVSQGLLGGVLLGFAKYFCVMLNIFLSGDVLGLPAGCSGDAGVSWIVELDGVRAGPGSGSGLLSTSLSGFSKLIS